VNEAPTRICGPQVRIQRPIPATSSGRWFWTATELLPPSNGRSSCREVDYRFLHLFFGLSVDLSRLDPAWYWFGFGALYQDSYVSTHRGIYTSFPWWRSPAILASL